MDTLADQYYLKAMDNYPWDLEEVVENLTYALSYDNEHVGANSLMGKFYMEQIHDYALAESYFQAALATDPRNLNVCLDYGVLLIMMKAFGKAERVIEYLMGFKDADLARVNHLIGLFYEYQYQYESAIAFYEDAIFESYNEEATNHLNGEIKRVKEKQKLRKKPASGKGKSK